MASKEGLKKDLDMYKKIKMRISATDSLLSDINIRLNDAHNTFTGYNSKNIKDWAYTDDGGKQSVDRGRIKVLISDIKEIKNKIGKFKTKLETLIKQTQTEYDKLTDE